MISEFAATSPENDSLLAVASSLMSPARAAAVVQLAPAASTLLASIRLPAPIVILVSTVPALAARNRDAVAVSVTSPAVKGDAAPVALMTLVRILPFTVMVGAVSETLPELPVERLVADSAPALRSNTRLSTTPVDVMVIELLAVRMTLPPSLRIVVDVVESLPPSITRSVGSISSVPARPFGAVRSSLIAPTVTAFFALSSTKPASLCFELTSTRAPAAAFRFPSAKTMMLPPLPAPLLAASVAPFAMLMSLTALTEMLPASPVRLLAVIFALAPSVTSLPAAIVTPLALPCERALSLPFTRALSPATIWIEPLRTTMPEELRRPLLLTVAANFAACATLALRFSCPGPIATVWPISRTPSAALMRPRIAIVPSGESGTLPSMSCCVAVALIWPVGLIRLSMNWRLGVVTVSAPVLMTPDLPTTNPCGSAK